MEWWLEHRHGWLVKRQWAGSWLGRVTRDEYQVLGSTSIPARLDTLVYRESFSWLTSVGTTRNTVNSLGWSRIGLAVLILNAAGAGLTDRPAVISGRYNKCHSLQLFFFFFFFILNIKKGTRPGFYKDTLTMPPGWRLGFSCFFMQLCSTILSAGEVTSQVNQAWSADYPVISLNFLDLGPGCIIYPAGTNRTDLHQKQTMVCKVHMVYHTQ